MCATTQRPLTTSVRDLVRLTLRSHGLAWRSWGHATLAACIALSVVVSMAARAFAIPRERQWTIALGSLAAWVAASIGALRRLRRRFGFDALRSDLRHGVASVERHAIAEVVRMEEFEDLGPAFYCRLSDGRVLFLIGQYLDEHLDDGSFPCARVEIARAPASRTVLGVRCTGAPLAPTRVVPAFPRDLVRRGRVPADGAILDVAWDQVGR
jgi:hypothetical protein